jgi:GNAT superfamily N-acetyltransferase
MNLDKAHAAVTTAAQELAAAGLLRPVDFRDRAEVQLWRDMDLCSMVEGAFAAHPDPFTLQDDERQRWLARLGDRYEVPSMRGESGTPFWLLAPAGPGPPLAGTLNLGSILMGPGLVPLSALYLVPAHRRAGLSGRALEALLAALVRAGCSGIRLETYWVWQDAARYYLRRGFWLFHWKHDLALMRHKSLPERHIEIEGDAARFSIRDATGIWQPLYEARREGAILHLQEGPLAKDKEHMYFTAVHGLATFSLALALSGWPLCRSPEAWQKHRYSESGPPEALAYRIEWYEALARDEGWHVDTPRIPGLRYPSYAELTGPAT